jgi:uncharacterized protein YndB with AHSA1/START domain
VPAIETLELERSYAESPQRVFEAWTRVDLLNRWFGCAEDKLWRVHAWEPRPGGKIHVSLDFDGTPFEVEGEFLVVDPPRRLTYRWNEDEEVDVTIEPHGSGSRLRLVHTFPATKDIRPFITMGWSSALDALGAVST